MVFIYYQLLDTSLFLLYHVLTKAENLKACVQYEIKHFNSHPQYFYHHCQDLSMSTNIHLCGRRSLIWELCDTFIFTRAIYQTCSWLGVTHAFTRLQRADDSVCPCLIFIQPLHRQKLFFFLRKTFVYPDTEISSNNRLRSAAHQIYKSCASHINRRLSLRCHG